MVAVLCSERSDHRILITVVHGAESLIAAVRGSKSLIAAVRGAESLIAVVRGAESLIAVVRGAESLIAVDISSFLYFSAFPRWLPVQYGCQ